MRLEIYLARPHGHPATFYEKGNYPNGLGRGRGIIGKHNEIYDALREEAEKSAKTIVPLTSKTRTAIRSKSARWISFALFQINEGLNDAN